MCAHMLACECVCSHVPEHMYTHVWMCMCVPVDMSVCAHVGECAVRGCVYVSVCIQVFVHVSVL